MFTIMQEKEMRNSNSTNIREKNHMDKLNSAVELQITSYLETELKNKSLQCLVWALSVSKSVC